MCQFLASFFSRHSLIVSRSGHLSHASMAFCSPFFSLPRGSQPFFACCCLKQVKIDKDGSANGLTIVIINKA